MLTSTVVNLPNTYTFLYNTTITSGNNATIELRHCICSESASPKPG